MVEGVMTSPLASNKGFSLIEILMVIILIGILAVASIDEVTDTIDEGRFEVTRKEMYQIRDAIIGNRKLLDVGGRVSFGFNGDNGALPAALGDLTTNPGNPVWAVDAGSRIGVGWNGPYLLGGDDAADFTNDSWGNAYVWSPGDNPPTLVSLGADGLVGGAIFNQDITISLETAETTATVSGFIQDGSGPLASAAEVEIFYPDGAGAIASTKDVLVIGDAGEFSFANIPFGIRSIQVFIPDEATTPTPVIGPMIFTVDRLNVYIPPAKMNINP